MHKQLIFLIVIGFGCTEEAPEKTTVPPTSAETEITPDSQPEPDVETDTGEQVTDTGGDTAEPTPEPVNLIQNASFEDGEQSWNIWGGAQRLQEHSQDGDWSLKAFANSGAEQLIEGLTPNTTYRLSGWGKSDDQTDMTIGVKNHGSSQQLVVFSESSYVQDSLTFSTGLSNTSAVIFAYKHSGDGAGYADNLSLFVEGEGEYLLTWSDEFDGTGSPDPLKWGFENGFVRNQELQWYQSENAIQQDGYLVIEGRQEQRPNPNYIPGSTDWRTSREFIEYTSSSIKTQGRFEWQYGRMVVRAKVSNLEGTWPAIWMLGVDCDWPSNGEIDIMENYGGQILGNFAWGSNQPWSPVWDTARLDVSGFDPDWINRFHLWELVWTESKMTILLDGNEVNSVSLSDTVNGSAACSGQNPFQQPHYVLLNLALGGNAGGSVDNLTFPTQYLVDYIRVYQVAKK